jgi:hypothetical protein
VTDKIQPALTAEEWQSPRVMFRPSKSVPETAPDFAAAGVAEDDYPAYYRLPWPRPVKELKGPDGSPIMRNVDEGYGIEKEPIGEGWCWVFDGSWSVTLGNETRHKLAALALHGQPFGFTREDVDDCREAGDAATCGNALPDDLWGRMNNLAARIEAMLPPEVK